MVFVVSFVFVFVALGVLATVRYVPNDRIGIVEKRFGTRSVAGGLVALAGEAGFQPEVLRGGLHILLPIQYAVHREPLVTIPQGKVGYVFARDGAPLGEAQTLGASVASNDYQDVRAFLAHGGQRGPQRRLLREGTYAINLAQFVVLTEERVYFRPLHKDDHETFRRMAQLIAARRGFEPVVILGSDDAVGVVTVHDGPALSEGEIIAPIVGEELGSATFHNCFQDPERFLAGGGRRGRQLQVLVEGSYFVNRLFATVELIPKTIVEVGTVGVVVSYTGQTGADVSGSDYSHGELVRRGQRGVWSEPLLPGKYAFNTYAGRVVMVPTTNFILKWNRSETGAHRYDENLAEVSLITKDAFQPSLPLSVVVHIDYRRAPLVIQRFGDIKKLVEQTLDPMVSAYFKNVAQTRTLIQLLQDRAQIQAQSGSEMRSKFEHYNLELEEVLIGTPGASEGDRHIQTILAQLRERQIAEEQVATYALKEKAALKERELREAEARSQKQQELTSSELAISILTNQGRAEAERAVMQAQQIRTLAQAEADRVRTMAEAEAERAARVGVAEAVAIEEQVRAYGGPRFQLTQQVIARFAEALEKSGVEVVPRVVVQSGAGGGASSNGVLDSLLALTLDERLGRDAGEPVSDKPRGERGASLEKALRSAIGGAG